MTIVSTLSSVLPSHINDFDELCDLALKIITSFFDIIYTTSPTCQTLPSQIFSKTSELKQPFRSQTIFVHINGFGGMHQMIGVHYTHDILKSNVILNDRRIYLDVLN